MTRPARSARNLRRSMLLCAAGWLLPAAAGVHASRPVPTAAAAYATGAPEMLGLSLGMPLEAAVRVVQAMAPAGSVTLPAVRRDTVILVRIEAPSALAAPADDAKKDSNFYVMLNSAPRILKTQSSRSSHVPFVTLVAGERDRRLVRIVFEPAFVYWPDGYDASRRTAWDLAERLRERYRVEVELLPADGGRRTGQAGAAGGPAEQGLATRMQSGWALRVNAARKSIVLSDVRQLPDAFASRLQLD
ncbi:MAG: hypothetical protein WCS09_04130 [Pseudomonadota bacterium]